MRRVLILLVVGLMAACGDGGGSGDVATAGVDPGSVGYSIESDTSYLGTRFFDETVSPYNAYPELGRWRSVGRTPVGNEYGRIILYRAAEGGGREDLIVMFTGPDNVAVDALKLAGDTARIHLDLVCPGDAAVLVPDGDLSTYRRLDEAIRAWRPGPSGVLEEFDPATASGAAGGC